MHVYLVSRALAGLPTEVQLNVEGISEPQHVLPALNQFALKHRACSKMTSAEFSVRGLDCVLLARRSSLLIAHSAYSATLAAQLLDRIDAGDSLISVLHRAKDPAALCHVKSEQCVDIMRSNLERMIRRDETLDDLVRSSQRLSDTKLVFRRHPSEPVAWCCTCM